MLATTEAHKVPPTIVDRCHRFDFQRPSLEEIMVVLRRIAEQRRSLQHVVEVLRRPDDAGEKDIEPPGKALARRERGVRNHRILWRAERPVRAARSRYS